jgi:pimeloyl-ACP methyl ester carboxylesterase
MTLGYDRRGAGEPLVLIHPLGGDRHVWTPVLDWLAAERDVVAVDLPGFGSSAPLSNGAVPHPAALASVVSDFARALGIERPHVAGNSLGGWVALELALSGAARSVTTIAAAGLWSGPLRPRRPVAHRLARALTPLLPLLLGTRAGRRLALMTTVAHPDRVPRAEALRLVRAYGAAPGFADVSRAMRAGRFEGLERIRVPVTLAWADHDRIVSRPKHLPQSVHSELLKGCGHVPMWDDPEQVAGLLLRGSSRRD